MFIIAGEGFTDYESTYKPTPARGARGPGRLRFIIQPLVAILLGSVTGSIVTPLLVGFMVSLIVQHYIFRSVRLWHAIKFGIGLIALPYVVARALTNRFIRLPRLGQRAEL